MHGAPGEFQMSMRMLIDARHPEETRVAVVKGNRIEEFDFESAEHKQLKGNIYLAKVTRVEPSLQAAFNFDLSIARDVPTVWLPPGTPRHRARP